MKQKLILLSLLLAFFCINYAQTNYKRGYVITNENDTLYGWIDYRTDYMNSHTCNFQMDSLGEVTHYSPGQIAGYRFSEEGKYYITHTIKIDKTEENVFLEYLLHGIINLYFYPEKQTRLNYYIFEDRLGKMTYITKKPDEEIEIDSRTRSVREDTRYKRILLSLFRDYEPLYAEINNLMFEHNAMIDLTQKYHNAVCKTGEACVIFVSKPDKHYVKVKFSVYGGVEYQNSRLHSTNLSPLLGGQIALSIPRWQKSLSLLFDVNLTYLKQKDYGIDFGYPVDCSYSAIRLTGNIAGRYTYPKGKIRPNVEIGINLLSGKLNGKAKAPTGEEIPLIEFSQYPDYSSFSYFNNFFVGAGVDVCIKKEQSIFIHINYQIPVFASDYQLLQAKLGYNF